MKKANLRLLETSELNFISGGEAGACFCVYPSIPIGPVNSVDVCNRTCCDKYNTAAYMFKGLTAKVVQTLACAGNPQTKELIEILLPVAEDIAKNIYNKRMSQNPNIK